MKCRYEGMKYDYMNMYFCVCAYVVRVGVDRKENRINRNKNRNDLIV